VSYKYVSLSWQLVKPLSCTTLTLLLSLLWTLMSILFLRLINSSLLCMLTLLRQWSFLLCSVTMFCLYRSVSHHSRWELINCHTSMQFWFRVKMCWFLTVVQQSFCLINPHLTGIFNNPRLQPLLLHCLLTDLHEINYLRPSNRALQLCHPWKLLSLCASQTHFILHLISSHQLSILQLIKSCHSLSYASIVACLTVGA